VARANGAAHATVSFPDGASFAPVRIRVSVEDRFEARAGGARRSARIAASAQAELAPPSDVASLGGGGYDGPFAHRQGKLMRPDVAQAFDRMESAARADGVVLVIASAFRSDAEQAVLYARHPDPRWVAPPGRSLHRYGTELDLGPRAAHSWLAAQAGEFHFAKRYSWEPWHFGYTLNAHSSPPAADAGADGGSAVPDFVPAAFAPAVASAAQRFNVSATLLAAQLYAESNFNPFATSAAGAEGIAQFMPGTAAAVGLRDPFDAERAIDAQAHLMRDLLRRFPAVALALAAYNAGPAAVEACGCVPSNGETPGYVARILGLMGGAGEAVGGALEVRLVG
jgi:Transglycosylase SLT domain/D-alanyl-D-alanine carboxypeptidase